MIKYIIGKVRYKSLYYRLISQLGLCITRLIFFLSVFQDKVSFLISVFTALFLKKDMCVESVYLQNKSTMVHYYLRYAT